MTVRVLLVAWVVFWCGLGLACARMAGAYRPTTPALQTAESQTFAVAFLGTRYEDSEMFVCRRADAGFQCVDYAYFQEQVQK